MVDEAPVFTIAQPDGTHVDIDLSAAGDMGDFAFRARSTAPGRSGYFFAYHTGEASIFVDVSSAWRPIDRQPTSSRT